VAQSLRSARGEATIQVDETSSLAQARQQARDQATIDALQRAFGTRIVQGRITRMQSATGPDTAGTTTYFNLIADSYVRGEWVETTREHFEQFLRTENGRQQLWLKCTLEGTAREIAEARPQLEIETLNCPSLNCASAKFVHGDRLYVGVKAPVDGYLQLYLEDADTVYSLLPYQRMPGNQTEAFKVVAQQPYVLFSTRPEHNYFEQPHFQEDELELTATGVQTYHRLYAVFSPTLLQRPFIRSGQQLNSGYSIPRSTSRTAFQEWLSHMKLSSATFYVQTVDLIVVHP
jgi:hypothetical protein